MEFWVKVGLFTTGYLPLFFILTLKSWANPLICAIMMSVLVFNCIWLYYLAQPASKNILLIRRQQNYSTCVVDRVDTDEAPISVYIIWYIVPFLNLTDGIAQSILLLAMLVGLFKLYTQSDLVCINPVLMIAGYRLYNVKAHELLHPRGAEVLLLTNKKRIDVHDQIDIDILDSDVYLDA